MVRPPAEIYEEPDLLPGEVVVDKLMAMLDRKPRLTKKKKGEIEEEEQAMDETGMLVTAVTLCHNHRVTDWFFGNRVALISLRSYAETSMLNLKLFKKFRSEVIFLHHLPVLSFHNR